MVQVVEAPVGGSAATAGPGSAPEAGTGGGGDGVQHHPYRWRLNRAGIVNVWYYFDTELELAGGRLILRGTNGSGKSRALELLLPFLLDADRRRMDATGSGKVRLQDLMRAGGQEQPNRAGYLWLELERDLDPETLDHETLDGGPAGPVREHLTIGAHVRWSRASGEARVWYFTTPLRVGADLRLLDSDRRPLGREQLADLIGAERITETPETHRERVRGQVFGLTGESGRERYAGLLQLLHTLRSPDVGNRIEEGRLPQILSDALPPLGESAVASAGAQLDDLSETRAGQQRLEATAAAVTRFLDSYRRYATGALAGACAQVRSAATAVRAREDDVTAARERGEQLERDLAAQRAAIAEAEAREGELDGRISGVKESRAYAEARDLDQRERVVAALAATADSRLQQAATARRAEAAAVADADARAAEVLAGAGAATTALEEAARALAGAGLPANPLAAAAPGAAGPAAHLVEAAAPVHLVRTAREEDPLPQPRPVPAGLDLGEADLDALAARVEAAADAVGARARSARARLEHARALDSARREAEAAESTAGAARERVAAAAEEAEQAQVARDDAAIALARAWRDWVRDPDTVVALGDVAWDGTAVAALLSDVEALVGDPDGDDVGALDHAPAAAAAAARDAHARTLAALAEEQQRDGARAGALAAERDLLAAEVDTEPPSPPWRDRTTGSRSAVRGVPLWRAVDFAETLGPDERAGLEGALLDSGLLTAVLPAPGNDAPPEDDLTAADGVPALAVTGPVAARPLSGALVPDPASPLPTRIVESVLERIGLDDAGAPIWVACDGRWGSGPLRGCHLPDAARYVGAAARAAARQARLTEIAAELAALAEAETARARRREEVESARRLLEERLRTAPRSEFLVTARAVHARTADWAAREARAASAAASAAGDARAAWLSAGERHRALCAELALPEAAGELEAVERACAHAAAACDGATREFAAVRRRIAAHRGALERVGAAGAEREQAEATAETEWRQWHSAAAELGALREHAGAEATRVREELHALERALVACREQLRGARARESALAAARGTASADARNDGERLAEARAALAAAGSLLTARLTLPGVLAAATGGEHGTDEGAAVDVHELAAPVEGPDAHERRAGAVLALLDRAGATVDETALAKAQQLLEREAAGVDVLVSVSDGVRLVEIVDASGRHTLAATAARLTRLQEEGRAALSERERRVFTEFVLGGIADELRRRLGQAAALVDAMNASLATISTSHGIGVKLRWRLADGAGGSAARIRALVTGQAAGGETGTGELTDLLQQRVEGAYALDPGAGYAAHLAAALDYRSWHEVEVVITGPEPGRERRISRRAKLSQGETRFVSYVALFAAVDAYLSGLPDTGRALRLLLLDDAFAKVDDRTIGELMGLLVRLDLDFVMTGHALWGCYPQVPALDCYEVRRREGTPAVTTHVHWDGRTRHLRPGR